MRLLTSLLICSFLGVGSHDAALLRAAVPHAGTVHGTITIRQEAPKRVANRYTSAAASTQKQQPMNAVVYLRGAGLAGRGSPTSPEMAQRDTTFTPNVRVITVGSAVEFRNQDPFFHNVFSYSRTKRFDLGRFPMPESKSVTFDQAGVVNVFCEIHKSMRAVVIVVDNPYHAVAAADGTFEIRDVPPGRYELVVWHVDNGTKTLPVQVPASGSVRVDATL